VVGLYRDAAMVVEESAVAEEDFGSEAVRGAWNFRRHSDIGMPWDEEVLL